MVKDEVKSHQQAGLGQTVAKRLTKALRGKRRWVGVLVSPFLKTRGQVENQLAVLVQEYPEANLRLMDFVSAERQNTLTVAATALDASVDAGRAVLRVTLQAYPAVRDILEASDAMEAVGLRSVTSSGKIRLVRERMGLPKPPRRR
jgi:ABC-type sugar transport system substrate-binding protein